MFCHTLPWPFFSSFESLSNPSAEYHRNATNPPNSEVIVLYIIAEAFLSRLDVGRSRRPEVSSGGLGMTCPTQGVTGPWRLRLKAETAWHSTQSSVTRVHPVIFFDYSTSCTYAFDLQCNFFFNSPCQSDSSDANIRIYLPGLLKRLIVIVAFTGLVKTQPQMTLVAGIAQA